MKDIHFTKMHGIGNDYIYIDCSDGEPEELPELAVRLSDRHKGIGGDGIILICPSDRADFKMRIFNADGSEAKMCGNGSRCVGKYVYDKGLTDKKTVTLETLAGIKTLDMKTSDGKVESVTVDMGKPVLTPAEIPVVTDIPLSVDIPVQTSLGKVRVTAVSMGNPHGVIFTEDLSDEFVLTLGPELEKHPMWPDRANIEFARVDSRHHITMRVWERGSGETMACGTGACATAVAAQLTGRADSDVTIALAGGDLSISLGGDGHVYMTGGATTVFEGTVTI
ncbi:MAG: diaminopimelate epimerase [Muribaculaceae bacterium]|nr:diaminopimelate epimerase [Muribaculaceae bacterium]